MIFILFILSGLSHSAWAEQRIHVAPTGHNHAPGTLARPLRTVSAALARVVPSGTVVLRAGTYREALPALHKPIVLRSHPGEVAVLKGSTVVRGWRRDGAHWRRDGWPTDLCATCHDAGNIDPDHPLAGLPDQVFVDGRPLRQVARLADLTPGTFLVDRARERLHLADDPTGRLVEASVHAQALTIGAGAGGTRVEGLTFAHYAPSAQAGLGAAVRGDAPGLVFENNTFALSAAKGLSIFKPDATVRGNTFRDNGMMGLEAWQANGLVVADNRFVANNREGFAQTGTVSEAAGAKITDSRDVAIVGNTFADNRTNGLWLDISVRDARIVANRVRGNARHGIFYEWSSDATIEANDVTGNGVSGIAIADADGVVVRDNVLEGNAIAFVLQRDGRPVPPASGQQGARLVDNRVRGGRLIWARDYTGKLDADALLSGCQGNLYWREGAGRPVAEWWRGGEPLTFDGVTAFGTTTGCNFQELGR